MTRCESYPPCFGTIYFPTAPFYNLPSQYFAFIHTLIPCPFLSPALPMNSDLL